MPSPSSCCRLAVTSVCRRWHGVTLSPPLLAKVDIWAGGDSWLQILRGATSWLVRGAAGTVQQLLVKIASTSDLDTLMR